MSVDGISVTHRPIASPECDPHSGCITCSDEALPMRVIRVDDARGLALCTGADGERSRVEVALVQPVVPGDVLLVHAGTALTHAPAGAAA